MIDSRGRIVARGNLNVNWVLLRMEEGKKLKQSECERVRGICSLPAGGVEWTEREGSKVGITNVGQARTFSIKALELRRQISSTSNLSHHYPSLPPPP